MHFHILPLCTAMLFVRSAGVEAKWVSTLCSGCWTVHRHWIALVGFLTKIWVYITHVEACFAYAHVCCVHGCSMCACVYRYAVAVRWELKPSLSTIYVLCESKLTRLVLCGCLDSITWLMDSFSVFPHLPHAYVLLWNTKGQVNMRELCVCICVCMCVCYGQMYILCVCFVCLSDCIFLIHLLTGCSCLRWQAQSLHSSFLLTTYST